MPLIARVLGQTIAQSPGRQRQLGGEEYRPASPHTDGIDGQERGVVLFPASNATHLETGDAGNGRASHLAVAPCCRVGCPGLALQLDVAGGASRR